MGLIEANAAAEQQYGGSSRHTAIARAFPLVEHPLLLNLPTNELLEKFGAGSHKPGSGSAAALQGLLCSQLLRTVIELTSDPKRTSYTAFIPKLIKIKNRIEDHIYPSLQNLLQTDAVEFDRAIRLRQARDSESDPKKKRALSIEAANALIPAMEVPIAIGNHCAELADFSIFIFDNGYKSARGDTVVAMNSALAAVSGCVSIIDLNLLSVSSIQGSQILSQLEPLRTSLTELQEKARLCEDTRTTKLGVQN